MSKLDPNFYWDNLDLTILMLLNFLREIVILWQTDNELLVVLSLQWMFS